MILEFSVSNFKSIGEKVTLSMVAGTDHSIPESLHSFGKFTISDKSILYGANGSGKSSLFQALQLLTVQVKNSFYNNPGDGILVPYNKLLGHNTSCEIEIQFFKDDIRYVYGCSFKNYLIDEEYLYYYSNNRMTKVFDRGSNTILFGPKFKSELNGIKSSLKPNKLFLSIANNLLTISAVESAFNFFAEDLIFYDAKNNDQNSEWFSYSIHKLDESPALKHKVLRFINELGVPVRQLETKTHKSKISLNELSPLFSEEFKAKLVNKESDIINVTVYYDGYTLDLFAEESSGIIKLFGFLCPFFDIIDKNKVILVDEIECFLHESIVHYIIQSFSSIAEDSSSQMICITHDTNLLDLNIFRRDQIWFTEAKPVNRQTDLYSLVEISGIRKGENISKNYLAGKYGAIPALNSSFTARNSDKSSRTEEVASNSK